MTAQIVETVERDGKRIAVYDNGMERDIDRSRIIKPPTAAMLTPEKSNDLLRRRLEKKRERALAGANAALEGLKRNGKAMYPNPQDMDYVEALTFAQMRQALTGDAYSTKAAEFVMRTTGMDERTVVDEPGAAGAADVINAATALLTKMNELLHAPRNGAIDGLVTESDISESNNVRIDATPAASPTDESEAE